MAAMLRQMLLALCAMLLGGATAEELLLLGTQEEAAGEPGEGETCLLQAGATLLGKLSEDKTSALPSEAIAMATHDPEPPLNQRLAAQHAINATVHKGMDTKVDAAVALSKEKTRHVAQAPARQGPPAQVPALVLKSSRFQRGLVLERTTDATPDDERAFVTKRKTPLPELQKWRIKPACSGESCAVAYIVADGLDSCYLVHDVGLIASCRHVPRGEDGNAQFDHTDAPATAYQWEINGPRASDIVHGRAMWLTGMEGADDYDYHYYYEIKNVNTGECVDAVHAGEDGSISVQYCDKDSIASQHWYVTDGHSSMSYDY